jgi:hypothetical protein
MHNSELWSAVRQGAGILAEAVPIRGGNEHYGEKRRSERRSKHPSIQFNELLGARHSNGAERTNR